MSGPLVSVCILAYNDAAGLRRSLRYLQAQSYAHLEILISDDASPQPAVGEAAHAAAQTDARIRVFRQPENLGIIGNHRFLLSQAQGKYLLWACQDDHWHPDYIREGVAALEAQPAAVMALGQARVLDPQGRQAPYAEHLHTVGLPPLARFRQTCREIRWWNNAFYGLFRREALGKVPFPDSFGFDLVQVALLSLQGSFVQLPQPYFVKQAGGVGNQLASSLRSIKVKSRWWLRWWPALGVWLALVRGLLRQPLRPGEGLRYLWASGPLLWSRPFGGVPRWRRVRRYLRQQKYHVQHRLRRQHARLFLRGSRQAIHRAYPWVRRRWLHPTGRPDQFRLAPLGLTVFWPQHRQVFNDLFGLQELQAQGAELQAQPSGSLRVRWQGLDLDLPGTMELEVLKEVGLAGVYEATFPPESVLLDVGMNTGLTALWLARHPEIVRVYGYEPMPALFAQAQAQFGRHPDLAEKIVPQPYGLAAQARTAVFAYARDYGVYSSEFLSPPGGGGESVSASLRAIGDEMARITACHPSSPLILKLDAEGVEYELLPALAEAGWLSRLAFLMIEWHARGPEPLLEPLHAAGFHTLLRQGDPERGMIYALAPGQFPLPLFQMCLHATY